MTTVLHPRPLRRRTGFTLIELLVVISIIGILAALHAVGAFMRVREGQASSNTATVLSKINSNLDRRWQATLDQVKEDTSKGGSARFNQLLIYADGDRDRAEAILAYALLTTEFPTTRAEAVSGVTLGTVTIPARSVFNQLPAAGWASEEDQSAACLYIALTATAIRGEAMGTDGLDSQSTDIEVNGQKVKVFVDSWGTPIAFSRMSYSGEINSPPITRTPGKDPLDPRGRLAVPTANWFAAAPSLQPNSFWTTIASRHLRATTGGVLPSSTVYTTQNWVPTAISAGPNKQWGAQIISGTGADLGSDNVLSFRLRQQGSQGN